MALTARLHIQGFASEEKGYRILQSDFEFNTEIDKRGMIKTAVQGGKIELLITVENDSDLINWSTTQKKVNSGKIVFVGKENGKATKTINFSDAYLIHYHESFREFDPTTVKLIISVRKIEIIGVHHINMWKLEDI